MSGRTLKIMKFSAHIFYIYGNDKFMLHVGTAGNGGRGSDW